jgi:hypothetical protein
MVGDVSRALRRIEQDLDPHLPPAAVEAACRAAGHAWRERKLGPAATVRLMVVQMLHLNAATRALRHVAGAAVSAAAYCEARARLPVAAVQALLRSGAASLRAALSAGGGGGGGGVGVGVGGAAAADPTLWRGHRTLLVDGSGTLAPDTRSNRAAFPLNRNQRPGCSLPVPRVLGLFDAVTGLVAELLAFDLFAHEQAKVPRLHPLLAAGDLLVGDRGFCSFAHLAALAARGVLACVRAHQSQLVCFRPGRAHYDRRRGARGQKAQRGRPRSRWVRRLGPGDQLVRWLKPKAKDGGRCVGRAAFDALPDELEVREVRYRVGGRGRRTREVTVVTTLLDAARYPADAVAELYGIRWRAETHFRELKATMGMGRLKCRTADGVLKELAAYCLAYNLVRAVIARAAARQGTTPDRVSFADALRWLAHAAGPGEEVPTLVVNPPRPGRFEPRALKAPRGDAFPKLTRPRRKYTPTKRVVYKRLK